MPMCVILRAHIGIGVWERQFHLGPWDGARALEWLGVDDATFKTGRRCPIEREGESQFLRTDVQQGTGPDAERESICPAETSGVEKTQREKERRTQNLRPPAPGSVLYLQNYWTATGERASVEPPTCLHGTPRT